MPPLPSLALYANWLSVDNLGRFLVNLLAIAGGAAVGFFAAGLLLRLALHLLVRKKSPQVVTRLVSVLGGIGMGILVAFFVFGAGGGWGLGGAGGGLGGKGPGTGVTAPTAPTAPASTAPTGATGPTPTTRTELTGVVYRVKVLGGARVEGTKFYLPDGKREGLTLAGLLAELNDRKTDKTADPVRRVEMTFDAESVTRLALQPQLDQIARWAQDNGIEFAVVDQTGRP